MDLREQLRQRAHELQARQAMVQRTPPQPGQQPPADERLKEQLAERAHTINPVRCDYDERRLKAEILEMRASRGLVKLDEDGDPIPEPLGPEIVSKLGEKSEDGEKKQQKRKKS